MTQRTKNILLITGFIIALFVTYQLAVSKTIGLQAEVNRLEVESLDIQQMAGLSKNLNQRERYADSILQATNFKNTSLQNNLLGFLNKASEKESFTIIQFKEPHRIVSEEISKVSFQFRLQGSYKSIQKVLYTLEQEYNYGKMSHVSFEKKRNYRKGTDYLTCSVILESFVTE